MREISEGYKVFYVGYSNSTNGLGIIISEKFCDAIVEVNRVSNRLISIKIDLHPVPLHVISCYTPQTGHPDGKKDDFWQSLEAHILSFDQTNRMVISRDLNGHVGLERDGYRHTHGGQGFGIKER